MKDELKNEKIFSDFTIIKTNISKKEKQNFFNM
jgi:hypothetical protein